jgi:hypothetical protein
MKLTISPYVALGAVLSGWVISVLAGLYALGTPVVARGPAYDLAQHEKVRFAQGLLWVAVVLIASGAAGGILGWKRSRLAALVSFLLAASWFGLVIWTWSNCS